tara:strand:- start:1973 stop:2185 length:213 start_codon:yes stop_codon:yes gene_type:complete
VEKLKVGTLLVDNNKVGVIIRVITSGTLNTQHDLIKWRNNYEVYYNDGTVSIIGEATLHKLVQRGEVEIL